jgi:hypothetical protein
MNRCWALMAGVMIAGPAVAQQLSAPTTGDAAKAASRDAFGRSCLDIRATARGHITNNAIVDHVVSIQNRCPKSIAVKVCYVGSERCNRLDVQPYRRSDTILGTMTVRFFRYEVTELSAGQQAVGPAKSFTYSRQGL